MATDVMTRTARGFLALTCAALASATPSAAQSRYRGTAQPSTGGPAIPIQWSIFERGDTTATGWMEIGEPLSGPGLATSFRRGGDSLTLVTMSPRGDTTIWLSSSQGPTLEGNYTVLHGRNTGQTGSWRLEQQQDPARAPIVIAIILAACAIVGTLVVLATRFQERWWRRRLATPMIGVSDELRAKWSKGIGGWLAWYTIANGIVCVALLVGLRGVGDNIGNDLWMLRPIAPSLAGTLIVEAVTQALQPIGMLVGLVLITRRSPSAPLYWMMFLGLLGMYVIFDIVAVNQLGQEIRSVLGNDSGFMDNSQVQRATSGNLRLLITSLIWASYWARSKRVRARFGPAESTGSSSPGNANREGLVVQPGASIGSPGEPVRPPATS
jgi:hypothetical protein